MPIDVITLCNLGNFFIDSNGLSHHNIERHNLIEMWLQDRISTKYLFWSIQRLRKGYIAVAQ